MCLGGGADSSSGCKAYARATIEKHSWIKGDLEITFKEEEVELLNLNHDNTLVVSMRMINIVEEGHDRHK